tara:strand:+ start:595 stop:840 length:246 start_codon:yes stop_codon:yes gene_type:complete
VEYLEVGYSILPIHCKRGHNSESAIKYKNFTFENDLTDSLISIIHKENIGSRKVAINNGMSLFKNNLKNPNTDFDMYRISK